MENKEEKSAHGYVIVNSKIDAYLLCVNTEKGMHQTVYTDNISKAKIYTEYPDVWEELEVDAEDIIRNCAVMTVKITLTPEKDFRKPADK